MTTENQCNCPVHKLLHQNDLGLLVLRVSLSLMMLLHGIAKFHALPFIKGMLSQSGLPELLAYGVFVGEIIAPLLMLIGFRTRAAAAVFAFNMLVAIGMAHSGDICQLTPHGGWAIELPALYFFGAVALVFTGGGKWGVSSRNLLD